MKNENCLKRVMCPKCGQTEKFGISVLSTAIMTDDGVEEYDGAEYDGTHTQDCPMCGHTDTVDDFVIPAFRVTFEIYTPLSLEMGEADRRGWWMPGEWLHDECPDEPAFEFDPDLFDEDEHQDMDDAIFDWATHLLKREGAVHPSESPSDDARWWSTEDEVHSYETGAQIAKAFHFHGFSDELKERINREMAS